MTGDNASYRDLPHTNDGLFRVVARRVTAVYDIEQEKDALLVPRKIIGSDQAGSYVLVVNKDEVVEQRAVQTGQNFGELVVVTSGLKPDDRVIVSTTGRAPPGTKIVPQATTIAAPADLG